jgi:uncharacterized protein
MLHEPATGILLIFLGIATGIASGVLGIGGGLLMVPILTLLHVSVLEATATSLVGVLMSSISGSVQNWRSGGLQKSTALGLALAGIPAAQLGAWLGDRLSEAPLAFGFAALQLLAIYLMKLRQQLQNAGERSDVNSGRSPHFYAALPMATIPIGLLAGLLSGLFGVGGGLVIVPLQMLLLSQSIKQSIRNSLGAIVLISASGLIRQAYQGNVLWIPGVCLGMGGIVGAQLGTRVLPQLSDATVNRLFAIFVLGMAMYMVVRGVNAL